MFFPLLEHTGLDGDRADDGADDEHTGVRNFVYANSRSAEFANSAAVSCEFVIRFWKSQVIDTRNSPAVITGIWDKEKSLPFLVMITSALARMAV